MKSISFRDENRLFFCAKSLDESIKLILDSRVVVTMDSGFAHIAAALDLNQILINGATDYKYPHGIAVSKGMDIANFLSYKLGYMNEDLYHSIKHTLKAFYTNTVLPDLDNFIRYLKQDKKNTSTDKLTCILSKSPGKMFIQQIDYFKLKELLTHYI